MAAYHGRGGELRLGLTPSPGTGPTELVSWQYQGSLGLVDAPRMGLNTVRKLAGLSDGSGRFTVNWDKADPIHTAATNLGFPWYLSIYPRGVAASGRLSSPTGGGNGDTGQVLITAVDIGADTKGVILATFSFVGALGWTP